MCVLAIVVLLALSKYISFARDYLILVALKLFLVSHIVVFYLFDFHFKTSGTHRGTKDLNL